MSEDLEKIVVDSARGTFFLATGNTISIIISAISVFIMARLLGAELYGAYTLSLTIPALFLLFIDIGINQALIHFSASLHSKDEEGRLVQILRYGILFKTLIALIIFSVALLFSDHLAIYVLNRPDYGIYIRLGSLSIIFQSIFNTAGAVFIGLNHAGYSAITTTIQALVKTTLSSLLVLLGFGVIGAIIGFVMSFVIAAIVSIALLFIKIYKPLNSSRDEVDSINPIKTMLSYSFPLYLSAILLGLSSQLQNIILSIFSSDTAIGNFKASINFVAFLLLLTNAVVMSLLPAFSKLYKDSGQTKTFFTLANKYTTLLIVPVTMMFMIFSEELVQIIYGSSYQSAPFLLSLSVIPFFLVGLGRFTLGVFFNGIGETKLTFKMKIVYFIVFIVLTPLLTKTYSVPGLIIAILLSDSIETILNAYVAKTRFQVQPNYNKVARIYLVAFTSAIPTLFIVRFLPLPILLTLLLGGLTYLFMYLTLTPIARIIDKPELERIIQLTNNIEFLKRLLKPIIAYELKIITKIPMQ